MSRGLAVVIGMTIAYGASFLGMIFAYFYYKKHHQSANTESGGKDD